MKLAIVDYGSGNLRSVSRAFERAADEAELSGEILVTDSAEEVLAADRIVLPGVGAYADCRHGLAGVPGMLEALEKRVRHDGIPFLGICVGMQLLADRGLEKGTTPGLGWIGGEVRAMTPSDPKLKIPQIGWNEIHVKHPHPLLAGIGEEAAGHAYFVHSFHFDAADTADVAAITDYGGEVAALIARENIAGTQFHPEKSQTVGLILIRNFLRWQP